MIILGVRTAQALDVAGANTMIGSLVDDVGSVLASGLGVVLTLIAALIGLFFVVRFVMQKIGRAK